MSSIHRDFFPVHIGDVEFEADFRDPILGVEVAHCSVGTVLGEVQVIQKKFTGFSNLYINSRLG